MQIELVVEIVSEVLYGQGRIVVHLLLEPHLVLHGKKSMAVPASWQHERAARREEGVDNVLDGGRREIELSGRLSIGLSVHSAPADYQITDGLVDFFVFADGWHSGKR